MNMFKRIASVAVMAVMMLQIAVFAAPVPEDVIGTEYEEAASLLCALDIMVGDGTNFNPNDNITRAEFAQILMKTLKLDDAAAAYSPVGLFTDVPADNIFAPAVELGASIGAIQGYGDGIFGPEDNVLGTEAVKMMVYATGHDITAPDRGGYPAGYMVIAQEIGMLKGITGIDYAVPMTRGQAAVLCANTLKVNMLKKVSSGSTIKYVETEGVNLLSEKHDVYRMDGTVVANEVTGLTDSSGAVRSGMVQVDNVGTNLSGLFKVGETTIADALGKYVRVYYRYDEDLDESTVVSYEILSNKNETVVVDLNDIDYNTITNTRIEYWADKENDTRTTKLDIADNPSLLYNGAARTQNKSIVETFEQIQDEGLTGEVTFIDNEADGKVDVVNVMAYETIVVSRVDTRNYNITKEADTYINNERTVKIDIESPNVIADIVDMDNEPIEFDDIAEGDILSYARSDAGGQREYVYLKVCNDSVEGEVMEIGTKEGRYVLTIGEERYEITDGYMNYITKGNGMDAPTNQMRLKIGASGEFYLNAFGKIAYDKISGTSSSANFGFVRKLAVGTGTDDSLQLRIYTTDGAYVDYSTAGRVEIDGVSYNTPATIESALRDSLAVASATYYTETATDLVGAILYETDENGRIRMIDTLYKSPEESDYTLQPVKGTSTTLGAQTYNSDSGRLGSLYSVSASTSVIQLPNEYDDLGSLNKIAAGGPSMWSNGKRVTVQMLTTDPDSYDVQFVIEKGSGGGSARNLGDTDSAIHSVQMFVVQSVSKVKDSEGNPTIKVLGLQEGVEKEYLVNYEYYQNDLATDIWCFDAQGKDGPKKVFAAYAGQVTKDPARDSQILLEGDVIRFRLTNNEITFATPTYLIDAKLMRSDDNGSTLSTTRYRGFDLAIVNKLEGDTAFYKYLVNKQGSTDATRKATTKVEVDENGFVTSSASSNGENYTFFEDGAYIFGDTGMRDDEANTPSEFKIMMYDASKPAGQRVTTATDADLYDTSSNETPASLVLMQITRSDPRGMYIIRY